jgi:hypothetical protein
MRNGFDNQLYWSNYNADYGAWCFKCDLNMTGQITSNLIMFLVGKILMSLWTKQSYNTKIVISVYEIRLRLVGVHLFFTFLSCILEVGQSL